MRGKEKKGLLLWVLDKTRTAMGAPAHPGLDGAVPPLPRPDLPAAAGVERSGGDSITRQELSVPAGGDGPGAAHSAQVVTAPQARDLAALNRRLGQASRAGSCCPSPPPALLQSWGAAGRPPACGTCRPAPGRAPFSVREGGFIRAGYHPEVDRLRDIMANGKGLVASIEAREKEKTGIKSLKVGYNKVFGYYIEVSKSYYDQVPDTYIRKQTLTNCERFITQELKELEHEILSAQDRITALEFELFCDLREQAAAQVGRIQRSAAAVAQVDVLSSFAAVAAEQGYCRPEVDLSDAIEITEGRHPVVEKMLKHALFVPNDTHMDNRDDTVAIITGPNMAGKSTYMRQVALIVLMAQMGSFVPARSARI
ncbi:MAG: MutS-related protein, partial [Flavonifractor plautii]